MTEEQSLLQKAVSEIRSLRATNQILSAKVGVFDSMMSVFNTRPANPGYGMSEDVAWQIDKHLASIFEKPSNNV